MSATYCLGPFATRLRNLPRDQWKGEIEKLPTECPHRCGVSCRTYCASFARVQWRMAVRREEKEATDAAA